MRKLFAGKCILVTGGAGSIGRHIVKKLLAFKPRAIRSFDHDEFAQFKLSEELKKHSAMRYLIGDVRDSERVMRAMDGVDYVFHASALKHVPLCEYNPFEAVQTNVLGTQNVLDAAIRKQVRVVINISTDKAVNPIAAMGATKLLSERLTSSSYHYSNPHETRCASVRFGNVINSQGSVLPTFIEQIRQGGPVTITDTRMTRFVMSINQAVDLIFEAVGMARGGEIFILKMPTVKIVDLAKELIAIQQNSTTRYRQPIQLKSVGVRAGEKMEEELMTSYEAEDAVETQDMFIIPPKAISVAEAHAKTNYPGARKAKVQSYRSDEQIPMTREKIRQLLQEVLPTTAIGAPTLNDPSMNPTFKSPLG